MPTETEAPIACALPPADLQQRLAWIHDVTTRHLIRHRLEGPTLYLTYRAEAGPELERLVAQERECCAFLHLALHKAPQAVELTILAPEGARGAGQWLFEQFLPLGQRQATRAGCGCAPGACG